MLRWAATALLILTIAAAAQAAPGSPTIAHQYIVVLKGALPNEPTKRSETVAATKAKQVAASVKAKPLFIYNADLIGFAARLTDAQLQKLRHHSLVKYIERDERVVEEDTQTGAPWDLVRIDERALDINGIYNYSPMAGAGVTVYIIDTGIQVDNRDFAGRASFDYSFDSLQADKNGHGTHVAGIVAGTKYGVAKRATVVAVKVLGAQGTGSTSAVIAGVNWVVEHHVADKSVANMSLGGGVSRALDDAVRRLIDSGVFVSVAAGNNNTDACKFSPAVVPEVFTVAASDSNDRKASFSNHGPCVDAYAPGVAVTSDWIGSATAINTISGTSVAAPIVAGIAALYLSEHLSTPAETTAWIIDQATPGVIANSSTATSNRLVYKAGL